MPQSEAPPPALAAITDDLVRRLGQVAGLDFPDARLPLITQRLRDMHEMAAELDDLDLAGVEPANVFDPSWPEHDRR